MEVLSSSLPSLFFGIMGGALAEILGLYRLRYLHGTELPGYLRDPFYWIMTASIIIFGGGGLTLLHILTGSVLSPILALNIGASGPLIIGQLASSSIQPTDPSDSERIN